jgi:hypothetical protein
MEFTFMLYITLPNKAVNLFTDRSKEKIPELFQVKHLN